MGFRIAPAAVTLTGRLVELQPLSGEHRDGLIEAVREGDLHERAWYTSVPSPEGVEAEIERRLGLLATGEMVPFTAVDADGRILGMTSLYGFGPDVPRLHGCSCSDGSSASSRSLKPGRSVLVSPSRLPNVTSLAMTGARRQ